MDSRTRVTNLLNHKLADRMGLLESMWPETIPAWLNQGYPRQNADDPQSPAKAPHEVFGYDLYWGGPWFDANPKPGFSELVEEDEQTKLVKNSFGATLRYWKHKSGTPEHVSFEMDSRQKWDKMKEPLLQFQPERLGDLKAGGDGIRKLQGEGKYVTVSFLFVYELMRASMGDFNMMTNFLEDPEWVHDFCRTYTDFFIKYYGHYFEHAAKPDAIFVYDDLGYTNGLWASPAKMKELVIPYHKELVNFAHSLGIQAILHSCGDIRKGMDLILEAGYDCIQPMEAKVGNNVVEYAEKYGDKIAFMGNINVMILETGDRALIRKEIESKVRPLRDMKVPYIFHSDHSVPPTINYQTYQYALEVFREFAEY